MPSSVSLLAALSGIALVSGLLVVLAYQITLPRITANKRTALEKAIYAVLPEASQRGLYKIEEGTLEELPEEQMSRANAFAGFDAEGKLVGWALEGSARGYQDVVKLLYGYDPGKECVIGITVLQSSETPGLGDRVEKDPAFLANFECLDARLNKEGTAIANEIVTVKNGKKTERWQIDGISGATVTSKAVGKALRESTQKLLPIVVRDGRGVSLNEESEIDNPNL